MVRAERALSDAERSHEMCLGPSKAAAALIERAQILEHLAQGREDGWRRRRSSRGPLVDGHGPQVERLGTYVVAAHLNNGGQILQRVRDLDVLCGQCRLT